MTEVTELVEAHCHLDALSDEELETGLRDARAAGVGVFVTVGMDVDTSARGVEIAEAEEGVYAGVGLHPWLAQDFPDGPPVDELRDLARSEKVVALGEIGLDFVGNIWRGLSYDDPELQRIQEAALRRQLQLAQELELPVILHVRGAHEPITRILAEEEMGRLGGCVQFQDGGAADVERYTALNFFFTVGSSVTFPDPGGWHDAIRAIPDDALLLETDAPWLPHAGSGRERSVPADLTVVGETVARIRGTDPAALHALTARNLRRALPGIR